MELRSEPRFHVSAPAKLIPLDPNRSEISSVLVDVSATGMRAIVDAPLPAGETVLVELEDHLIIAETRHAQERGAKYSVGLRRVQEMMKSTLPSSRRGRLQAILHALPEYSENGESLDYLRESISEIVAEPTPARREAENTHVEHALTNHAQMEDAPIAVAPAPPVPEPRLEQRPERRAAAEMPLVASVIRPKDPAPFEPLPVPAEPEAYAEPEIPVFEPDPSYRTVTQHEPEPRDVVAAKPEPMTLAEVETPAAPPTPVYRKIQPRDPAPFQPLPMPAYSIPEPESSPELGAEHSEELSSPFDHADHADMNAAGPALTAPRGEMFKPKDTTPFQDIQVPEQLLQERPPRPPIDWKMPLAIACGLVAAVILIVGILHSRGNAKPRGPVVIDTATVPKIVISSPAPAEAKPETAAPSATAPNTASGPSAPAAPAVSTPPAQSASAPVATSTAKPQPAAEQKIAKAEPAPVKPAPSTVTPAKTPAAVPAASPAPKAPAAQEQKVVAKAEPAPSKPAPAATPKPVENTSTTAKPGAHHAQLKATVSSWISVSVDGAPLFAKMVAAGETRDIDFKKLSYVHLGNASGVELTLDGKPCAIGPGRALRLLKLDATGMHIIPWHDADPVEP